VRIKPLSAPSIERGKAKPKRANNLKQSPKHVKHPEKPPGRCCAPVVRAPLSLPTLGYSNVSPQFDGSCRSSRPVLECVAELPHFVAATVAGGLTYALCADTLGTLHAVATKLGRNQSNLVQPKCVQRLTRFLKFQTRFDITTSTVARFVAYPIQLFSVMEPTLERFTGVD
jgi:hypothetical protein